MFSPCVCRNGNYYQIAQGREEIFGQRWLNTNDFFIADINEGLILINLSNSVKENLKGEKHVIEDVDRCY